MTENINIQINDGKRFAIDDHANKTVYDGEKIRFKPFGDCSNDFLKENEGRIIEIVELTKLEYPTMDNYYTYLQNT